MQNLPAGSPRLHTSTTIPKIQIQPRVGAPGQPLIMHPWSIPGSFGLSQEALRVMFQRVTPSGMHDRPLETPRLRCTRLSNAHRTLSAPPSVCVTLLPPQMASASPARSEKPITIHEVIPVSELPLNSNLSALFTWIMNKKTGRLGFPIQLRECHDIALVQLQSWPAGLVTE